MVSIGIYCCRKSGGSSVSAAFYHMDIEPSMITLKVKFKYKDVTILAKYKPVFVISSFCTWMITPE